MSFLESRKPMGLIVFGLFAAIGGCATGWKELRLGMWGTTVTGKVGTPEEWEGHKRRARQFVDYQFRDARGKLRKANAEVPADWERPEGGEIEIVYLESDPEVSRFKSERRILPYVWLPAGLIAMALGAVSLLGQKGS